MPQSPRITLGIAANISISDTRGCRIQSGASSVRYAAVAMPNGTAINSAIREETSVPYINGRAPNWSATGSQVDVTRKWNPNFLMAPDRPDPQLPPGQNHQHNHRERHGASEPLKRFVAEARGPRHHLGRGSAPLRPGAPKTFVAGAVETSMLPHITFLFRRSASRRALERPPAMAHTEGPGPFSRHLSPPTSEIPPASFLWRILLLLVN